MYQNRGSLPYHKIFACVYDLSFININRAIGLLLLNRVLVESHEDDGKTIGDTHHDKTGLGRKRTGQMMTLT